MNENTLKHFKSMGTSLESKKPGIVQLKVSEDMDIAVEVIINYIKRTRELTGRIFKLVGRIDEDKTTERQFEISNSSLYNENKIHFDPETFNAYEYEPYMFVEPIISY